MCAPGASVDCVCESVCVCVCVRESCLSSQSHSGVFSWFWRDLLAVEGKGAGINPIEHNSFSI